jgi:hypothetical protein
VLPFLQAIIGDMVSLVAIMAILSGIIKLFQIATSLNEIKDVLSEIKRNTQDYPVVPGSALDRFPSEAGMGAESRPDYHSAILEERESQL